EPSARRDPSALRAAADAASGARATNQDLRPRRRLSGGDATGGFQGSRSAPILRRAARSSRIAGARISHALEREGRGSALLEAVCGVGEKRITHRVSSSAKRQRSLDAPPSRGMTRWYDMEIQ